MILNDLGRQTKSFFNLTVQNFENKDRVLKFILRISSVPLKDTDPSLLDSEYFFYTTLDDNAEYGFNIAEVRINPRARRPCPESGLQTNNGFQFDKEFSEIIYSQEKSKN